MDKLKIIDGERHMHVSLVAEANARTWAVLALLGYTPGGDVEDFVRAAIATCPDQDKREMARMQWDVESHHAHSAPRRDTLAGMVLQGMLANSRDWPESMPEEMVYHAVRTADALMTELDKPRQQ